MATSKKKTSAKKTTNGTRRVSKRGAKSVPPTAPKDEGTIPLKKICAELGIDANCATREKLRRALRNEENPGHSAVKRHRLKNRWYFTPAEAKKVKEILAPK